MTNSPQDNANHDLDAGFSAVPTPEDLAGRYDELLEFLLEFTHRQAQWDQRQQQLVDFQRRAVQQLRTTSFELVERHNDLESKRATSRGSEALQTNENHTNSVADGSSAPSALPPAGSSSHNEQIEALEEELKERIFEQKQLTQLTRLQRRKIAQQIRAQRAELLSMPKPKETRQTADLTPFLEQFQRELDQEKLVSTESVNALRGALDRIEDEKQELQRQLQDRLGDIDELKRLLVESQRDRESDSDTQSSTFQRERDELRELENQLKQRAQQLDHQDEKTRLQRKKLAQQFRAMRAEVDHQRARLREEANREEGEHQAAIDFDAHTDSIRQLGESLSRQLEAGIGELHERLNSILENDGESFDPASLDWIGDQLNEVRESLAEQVAGQHSHICERLEERNSEGEPLTRETVADELRSVRESLGDQIQQQQDAICGQLAGTTSSDSEVQVSTESIEELLGQLRTELDEKLSTQHEQLVEQLQALPTEPTAEPNDLLEQIKEEFSKQLSETQKIGKSLERKLGKTSKADKSAGGGDEELLAELESVQQLLRDAENEATSLHKENAELTDQVEELKRGSETGEVKSEGSPDLLDEIDRLQDALDNAKSQIRTLKSKVPSESGGGGDGGAGLDWESAKQRLLAELEAFDEDEPEQQRERLAIEEVIAQTDQVIAEKNEEIAELKHLLSHQSESIGEVAVGAAAIADLMDHDEIIKQERENLQQLQEEWKEKLRASEVELSLERARIARERAELEERLAQFESGEPVEEADGDDPDPKSNSIRGKWLERLGLRDDQK